MSVHKRSNNGTYYVAYRDGNGRQHTRSFGKGRDGKREAEKFDEQVKAHKVIEVPLEAAPPTPGKKIFLDELSQMYINAKKAEGKSIRRLKELAVILERHIIPAFAQRPVEQMRFDEIIGLVGKVYAKRSPVTRGRYLAYLKTVFQFGVDNELIEKNPLRRWKKPKERPRDTRLTVTDLNKIKAAAAPHLAWGLEVAWNLGVRTGQSELLALKWSDVDWENQTVTVYATKTKTRRIIPVSEEFLARLREVKEAAKSPFIVEYQGRPVKQISRAMRTACRRAGITYPVVLYDVRHLFATTLLREGGDLSAVSNLMGHSSIQMTANNYYHLLGDEKRRTIAKLPRLEQAAR